MECYGNKAQACGIHAIQTSEEAQNREELTVRLVGCAMKARNTIISVTSVSYLYNFSTDCDTWRAIIQLMISSFMLKCLVINFHMGYADGRKLTNRHLAIMMPRPFGILSHRIRGIACHDRCTHISDICPQNKILSVKFYQVRSNLS